jgi:hypothetical protein
MTAHDDEQTPFHIKRIFLFAFIRVTPALAG